jgi:hypothetical protein
MLPSSSLQISRLRFLKEEFAREGVALDDPGCQQRMAAPAIRPRQPLSPDPLDLIGVPPQSSKVAGSAAAGIVAPHHRDQMGVLVGLMRRPGSDFAPGLSCLLRRRPIMI